MKGIMVAVTFILLLAGCKDNNSNSEGPTGPQPPVYPERGTISGEAYCVDTSLTQNYHNGTGGTYSEVLEENSEECGWVPPAGTILNEGCAENFRGVKWFRIADGAGGHYSEKDNESVECGYEPPYIDVEVGAAGDTFNPVEITVTPMQYGEPVSGSWDWERTEDTIGRVTKTETGLEIRAFNGRTGIGEILVDGEAYQYEIIEEPICAHERSENGVKYDCQGHRTSGSSNGFIYYGEEDDRIVEVSMIYWYAASDATLDARTDDPSYRKLFGERNINRDGAVVNIDPTSSNYANAVRKINKVNEIFERSNVHIRIKLVAVVYSNYYNVGAARSMKRFMEEGLIPWADTVAQEGYSRPGTCGVAYPATSFGRGANPRTWLNRCGHDTLVHELGHNVGMAHGPLNNSNQASGYIFPDFGHGVMKYCGVSRASIMSYGHASKWLTNSEQTCEDQLVPEKYNYAEDPAGWRDPSASNGGSDEAYHLNRIRYNLSLITERDGEFSQPTDGDELRAPEFYAEEEEHEPIED